MIIRDYREREAARDESLVIVRMERDDMAVLLDRMVGGLHRFGRHEDGCAGRDDCSCGLEAMLRPFGLRSA